MSHRLAIKEWAGEHPVQGAYHPIEKPKPHPDKIVPYLVYGRGNYSITNSERRRIELQSRPVQKKSNPRLINLVKDLNLYH